MEIKLIGVVGAGQIGNGIAEVALTSGLRGFYSYGRKK